MKLSTLVAWWREINIRSATFIICNMGLIQLEEMEFYAYHGHYKEEQIVGNRFLVDLDIETDMDTAARTDDLRDALNYQAAYQIVKDEMQKKSHLLENIATRILNSVYQNLTGVKKATVKVSKINPPLGGKTRAVSVTLIR
jgi:7,8-dihydroneopterin aldolase/epimerase/oxygenase